jgi:hypothetical protein
VYQGLIGCADPVREPYLEDPGRILRIFEGFGVSHGKCSFEKQQSRLDDSKLLAKWQFCGRSWRFLNSLCSAAVKMVQIWYSCLETS